MHIPSQISWIPRFRLNGPVMHSATHQCLEVSNSSRLHPSGRHDNTSKCSSEFDKKSISFSETYMGRQLHLSGRQGNTVRTLSLIRQDVEKNCNCPDVKEPPSGHSPYYDIYVQQKCNHQQRPDAALISYCMERVMESRLHSCPS